MPKPELMPDIPDFPRNPDQVRPLNQDQSSSLTQEPIDQTEQIVKLTSRQIQAIFRDL